MPIEITVLYPADADFNMDYYLSSHMPMVFDKFGPHGMTGYRVLKLTGTASGDAAPYSVQATLMFRNQEGFQSALQAEAGPVLGDIPNFSDKEPVLIVGDVVGEKRS